MLAMAARYMIDVVRIDHLHVVSFWIAVRFIRSPLRGYRRPPLSLARVPEVRSFVLADAQDAATACHAAQGSTGKG